MATGGGPNVERVDPAVNDQVAAARDFLNQVLIGQETEDGFRPSPIMQLLQQDPSAFQFPGQFIGPPEQAVSQVQQGGDVIAGAEAPQFGGFDTPSQADFQRGALEQAVQGSQAGAEDILQRSSTQDLRNALQQQGEQVAQEQFSQLRGDILGDAALSGVNPGAVTGSLTEAAGDVTQQVSNNINAQLADRAFQDLGALRRSVVNRRNQRDFILQNIPQQADIIERRGMQREQQNFQNQLAGQNAQIRQGQALGENAGQQVGVITDPMNRATQQQAGMFFQNLQSPFQLAAAAQSLLGGGLNRAQIAQGGGGGKGGINPLSVGGTLAGAAL